MVRSPVFRRVEFRDEVLEMVVALFVSCQAVLLTNSEPRSHCKKQLLP